MMDSRPRTHHIFWLDHSSQQWVDTGAVVDNRPKTRSDVLWDGTKLYVASHVRASSSQDAAPGNPARPPNLNNATTTKQSVSSATGMVVMASNDVTRRYWHADLPLGSP